MPVMVRQWAGHESNKSAEKDRKCRNLPQKRDRRVQVACHVDQKRPHGNRTKGAHEPESAQRNKNAHPGGF